MSGQAQTLDNVCNIKRLQMLYNTPPYRYDPISPYPQNTQRQLDMRRKAEILKYQSNNQNSKTNGTTKAMAWSNLVNNNAVNKMKKQTLLCNQDMIPRPTYYSDVPGPVDYLVNDESIPLYNYNTNRNSFGITSPPEQTAMWQIITGSDLVFSNNTTNARLFRLFILNNVDQPYYSFRYTTPFAIYVSGVRKPGVTDTVNYNIALDIQNIAATVLYNNSQVDTVVAETSYNLTQVTFQTTPPDYSSFFYMGMLTIDIPNLSTTPGFIYDIAVSFHIALDTTQTTYYTNYDTDLKIYCNLSDPRLLDRSSNVSGASTATGDYHQYALTTF